MSRWMRVLAAAAGYGALAVAFTWPLALHLRDGYPGYLPEAVNNVWNLWHFRYSLTVLHRGPFWTDLQYWPFGANLLLAHYTPFNDALAFFAIPRLGLPLTYDLLILSSLVLSGLGVYGLLRDWGTRPFAAFAAGAFFECSPVLAWHFLGGRGADYTSVHALPFFVWALSRATRDRRLRDSALAALALTWVWSYNYYYFLSCALMPPLFWLVRERPLALSLSRRRGRWELPLDLAAGAAALWMLASLLKGQREFHGAGSARELLAYVAPYLAFWAALAVRLAASWTARPRLDARSFRWKALKPYALTALFWAALNLPLVWGLASALFWGDYAASGSRWRGGGSPVDLGVMLLPNIYNALWSPALRRLGVEAGAPSLGLLACALALWISRRSKDEWTSLWLAGLAACFVLMLGPELKAFGLHLYLPLPFYALHLLPVFSGMPNGIGFNALASLFLALLVGRALDALERPARLAAAGLLALEALIGPVPIFDLKMPPVVQRLGARAAGAVLPVPVSAVFHMLAVNDHFGPEFVNGLAAQIVHEKPYVGGNLGRVPRDTYLAYLSAPLFGGLLEAQSGSVDAAAPYSDPDEMERLLKAWRLKYVLASPKDIPGPLQEAMRRWPMRKIDDDGRLVLYEVLR